MTRFPKKWFRNKDANFRVTEMLTSYLRGWIESLPSSPKYDYLKEQAFSKFVSRDTDSPLIRRTRAINKWLATEANNEATNTRLLTLSEEYNILPRVTWGSFRETVRLFVREVIGDTPSWESFDGGVSLLGGFSGGATTSRRRTEGHPANKYLGEADVTPAALQWFLEYLEDSPVWKRSFEMDKIRLVRGNVLFTVPKNAQIDRCACKEPDLNMYLQRGFGTSIRRSLKRIGIDLNDQTRNRELARQGSITGDLATLDLSSASDSISYEVVAQFLPEVWLTALDACRSHVTVIDGEVHTNEMFSSMGNGFTFELESLLFYAIARAVNYHLGISGVVSVYGDDIIIPSRSFDYLTSVLGMLGFEVNISKSFSNGPFRESCGGHYYNGLDITPFYVKRPIERLVDVIHVCNSIRKWAATSGQCDPIAESVWQYLTSFVPKRFWGGHDTSFKGQLVSYWMPDKPKKLMPFQVEGTIPDLGRYLLWLDEGRLRVKGESEDSTYMVTLTKYREERYSGYAFRELDQYFYHEVMTE